ncbi:MAG: thioesterase family protein [Actinomycetota bacterium]|jgi:YbgC/YbaW family acyl-CoA thioester hydrolase|nr:thioesterase family protein [Actinomycetota bacterium]
MATHLTPIVPRFGELDPYNHVNHAVYVAYFEAARCIALEDIGMALSDLADRGIQIVVTTVELKFREPATGRDRLTVETEVAEIRRASSRWRQRIRRDADEKVLVEALVTAGVCDATGKPMRPPADLMDALATLEPISDSGD